MDSGEVNNGKPVYTNSTLHDLAASMDGAPVNAADLAAVSSAIEPLLAHPVDSRTVTVVSALEMQ
jgi:hypothetical protein